MKWLFWILIGIIGVLILNAIVIRVLRGKPADDRID